jgi:hypothetical protein
MLLVWQHEGSAVNNDGERSQRWCWNKYSRRGQIVKSATVAPMDIAKYSNTKAMV